jgi:hypothetical protein
MTVLSVGSRLRSQVDNTELIVVRAPAEDVDLRIGGHPAVPVGTEPRPGLVGEPTPEPAKLGKRYTRDADDIEILITKVGGSSVSIGEVLLHVKDAKPLPSSD